MKIALLIIAVVLLIIALDRLALYMERREWIYYRKKQPSSTSLGNAFLELQGMLEPGKKHVQEVKLNKKKEVKKTGENEQ
ncbi:MAG: hypothetical protein A2Y62_13910 [Candidatus Fischerbacteria bacterium RBG_13_37_8]|uniref:Uncharacterized protein n=1 Tax=Candidatus Fischerbacteria bacterium RBG_13_37_8 TaxID=1817863 RepID=A0A1F5VWL3_9BACT|nr:MAG: hypothetical protein A2Y62_13910 [Candidatus Fischerbacteria bacterium RBG_13_37_8]